MQEDRKGCRRADEILGRDVEYGALVVEVLRVELGRKGMHELAVPRSAFFVCQARDDRFRCFSFQGPPVLILRTSLDCFDSKPQPLSIDSHLTRLRSP